METPTEWAAVKLRNINPKETSGGEGEGKKSEFGGIQLKNAPKPNDYEGPVGEDKPKEAGNICDESESVYDKVRSGLKKVPQK